MGEWIQLLVAALEREFAEGPLVATLATVDADGMPHARSVVCRRIDFKGDVEAIVIVSDRRSAKSRQLHADPRAELVFWLPQSRTQFRLAGEVEVRQGDAMAEEIWRSLSDRSRGLFFWPTPGSPRDTKDEDFIKEAAAETPAPASFELLVLRPQRVERLDLNTHPHERRRWERGLASGVSSSNWAGIDINP